MINKGACFSGCFSDSTFLVDKSGNLHSFGCNLYGMLGLGDNQPRCEPEKLDFFDGVSVLMVSCGSDHSLFLTKLERELYACGRNDRYQLGNDSLVGRMIPTLVPFLPGKMILRITAGGWSSYILTADGFVYSFGGNESGQLGLGHNIDTSNPTNVEFPRNERIASISAGKNHVAALSFEGRIYSFGCNDKYQLGRDGVCSIPAVVEIPDNKRIREVHCGSLRIFALGRPNEVYSCGENEECCSLGNGPSSNIRYMERVNFFEKNPIKIFRVGGGHAICLLKNGELCVFGWNLCGQLMLGDSRCRAFPVVLSSKLLKAVGVSRDIVDICLGNSHSLIITKKGCIYGSGRCIAFNTSCHIPIPAILSAKVALFSYQDDIARSLEMYILKQQLDEFKYLSTDATYTVVDSSGNEHNLRMNRQFLQTRFGKRIERLSYEGEFTEAEKKRFLLNLYGASNVHYTRLFPKGKLRVKDLRKCMRRLFKKRNEGDVEIKCDMYTHRAHKFVLVARREYFRVMFENDWIEAKTNTVKMEMTLGPYFDVYLRYLYTGEMKFTRKEAKGILPYINYFDEGGIEDMHLRNTCECIGKICAEGCCI